MKNKKKMMAEDNREEDEEEDDDEKGALASADWEPDFHWLTDHLAVGGCFPMDKAAHLARAHLIRAVVDLRSEDRDDEEILSAAGIDFLHLPTPDMEAAPEATLDRGVEFAQAHARRGERVLIHCQHGIGRSALLALCVLIDAGFEPIDALAHAKDRRERISLSKLQYDGWAKWLAARGKPVPDYHSFGCVAYRHLAKG